MIRFLERVPHYRIYQVFLTWLYVKCSWTIIQYSDWLTMCNIVHSCLNFRYSLLSASQVLKFAASWSSGNIMALTLIQHTIHKLANLISYFCLLYVLNSCCNHGFGGPNENATHYTQGLLIFACFSSAQFLLQSRLWWAQWKCNALYTRTYDHKFPPTVYWGNTKNEALSSSKMTHCVHCLHLSLLGGEAIRLLQLT